MRRVIIESPYAGDIEHNVRYARRALRDSLDLSEAPLASHLLYTQALKDGIESERARGIQAGYEWMQAAEEVVFYVDLGWSPGMVKALKVARVLGKSVTTRSLQNRDTAFPPSLREYLR